MKMNERQMKGERIQCCVKWKVNIMHEMHGVSIVLVMINCVAAHEFGIYLYMNMRSVQSRPAYPTDGLPGQVLEQ